MTRWRVIRPACQAVEPIARGEAVVLLDDQQLSEFTGLYRTHIAREDANLLLLAQMLLGATELVGIGHGMNP
jgi:hypothetical protein